MKNAHLRVASLALLLAGSAALAQTPRPAAPAAPTPGQPAAPEQGLTGSVTDDKGDIIRIAIPAMPTQQVTETPAGSTELLGEKVAEVIANDLKGSGLFAPTGPAGLAKPTMAEVTAPA